MTSFDPTPLRARFPALSLQQGGRPIVYLDGPGGTQVPQSVIDAVSGYYRDMNANEGGAFVTSRRSDAMAEEAHRAVADLLGAGSAEEIVFGPNMTTLTFHLSRSIGATLAPGDEIVVTTLDHEANVSPWRALADDRGLVIRTVDIRADDGTLDLDDLDRLLGPRTRLVAIGYASNALGTVNPVAEIVRRAHAVGALTWVDAVHLAPHGSIDVRALGTDFLVCSAYKWFGPHIGALYGRAEVLDRLPTYKVRPSTHRFSTGTPNLEGIAGTLAAVEYLASVADAPGDRRARLVASMTAIAAYERTLSERFLDGVATLPDLRVWGISDTSRLGERTPTFAITSGRLSPRSLAERLGEAGILAWDGNFYAQALIERLGLAETGGVLRLGFVHYTTLEEVDRTLDELEHILAHPTEGTVSRTTAPDAARPSSGARAMNAIARRSWIAVLLAVVLVAQSVAPATGQSPGPAPSATATPVFAPPPSFVVSRDDRLSSDAALEPPELASIEGVDLSNTWRRAKAIVASLPDREWLTTSLADELEADPFAAFAWVRDHIGFDPYAGELRGAAGTLTGRAGNSLDRALLLQRLLDLMVVQSRLVHGTLDEAGAQAVVERSFERATSPLAVPPLDDQELGSLDTLATRARRDYARVHEALGDRTSSMDGSDLTQAIDDTREHVWVQMRYGSTWLDLDPTLPGARPGDTLTRMQGTYDEVPADLQHGVTIRVFGEVLSGGALSESMLLEQQVSAPDAATTQVYVAFQPADPGLGGTINEALGGSVDWEPALYVGGDSWTGSRFPITPGKDIFDQTVTDGPEVSRLRLEVAIDSPGGHAETHSQILLDRVPATLRTSDAIDPARLDPLIVSDGIPASLMGLWHIQVSTGGFDARAHQVWRRTAARLARLELSDPAAGSAFGFPFLALPMAVGDEALVLTSEELIRRGLDGEPGFRAFVAYPRVFVSGIVPGSAGQVQLQTNLMTDDVRILPGEDATAADAAERRMWYGALESASETQHMLRRAAIALTGPTTPVGTSLAMDQPLMVLAPTDAASLPATASQDLRDDLHAGSLAVVPGDPGDAHAWWAVDPVTGATRAMVTPGLGGQIATSRVGTAPVPGPVYDLPWNYTNGTPNTGPRIFAPGIDDPVATRAQMQQLAREAAADVERQQAARAAGGCGGSEYGTTLCIPLWAIVAFAVLGVVILVYVLFF